MLEERNNVQNSAYPALPQVATATAPPSVPKHLSSAPPICLMASLTKDPPSSRTLLHHQDREKRNADLERKGAQQCEMFSSAILNTATSNFADVLGKGASGSVYKGKLKDGREVAVKELKETIEGTKEFENEVKLLSSLDHPNVVKLFGYCAPGKKKLPVYKYAVKLLRCCAPPGKKNLLVYEYVPNNNLGQLLSKLDWQQRYDIILGIARGLDHIHHHSTEKIIHRDIKLTNILIDEKGNPKIGDFGLSRILLPEKSHVTTTQRGTWGYIAPELVSGARGVTVKTDVYSFGVVLLEIVSGKKFLEFQKENPNKSLLDWAYELYENDRSLEFMDSNFKASAVNEEVKKCIEIGLLCVQGQPMKRPTMEEVISKLIENQGDIKKTIEEPGLKGYYSSRSSQRQPSRRGLPTIPEAVEIKEPSRKPGPDGDPSCSLQQPQLPPGPQSSQETKELRDSGNRVNGCWPIGRSKARRAVSPAEQLPDGGIRRAKTTDCAFRGEMRSRASRAVSPAEQLPDGGIRRAKTTDCVFRKKINVK